MHMANSEHLSHSPTPNGSDIRDRGIAIIVTPEKDEDVTLKKFPDGGYTIFLRGEIQIAIRPSKTKLTDLTQDKAVSNALQASESPVTAVNGQDNGLVPENGSSKADAPHSGSETAPRNDSPTPPQEIENRKFELKGNPVYGPYYKARKSGKRLADFALATHDEHGGTKYWRIRAFDHLAERVRDTVRKGQKDVEAVVYGPKQWQQKKKTPEGWTQETVTGYYAGMVHVPERYRAKPEGEPTP